MATERRISDVNTIDDLPAGAAAYPETGMTYGIRRINDVKAKGPNVHFILNALNESLMAVCDDGGWYRITGDDGWILVPQPKPRRRGKR